MGMDGLSRYLEGPSVLVWGGDGVAELAKEVSAQVKTLKKPEIKGGAVDGVVIGPGPGRGHHQAPQPRGLDRPGGQPGAGARCSGSWPWPTPPAGNLMGQLKTLSEGTGDEGGEPAGAPPTSRTSPAARRRAKPGAETNKTPAPPCGTECSSPAGCVGYALWLFSDSSLFPCDLTHAPRMIMI